MLRNILIVLVLMIVSSWQTFPNQAIFKIINQSNRYLSVKIMKWADKNSILHDSVEVSPKGKVTIYFKETGRYFTKIQAILVNKDSLTGNDTIYSKGKPFEVIADPKKGYSEMIMKYTINESKKAVNQDAISITRDEFHKN